MAEPASPLPTEIFRKVPLVTVPEIPRVLSLQLIVTDLDSLAELLMRAEGRDRDEYSLCALRIGLLSLKYARGQVDADTVKREGEKILIALHNSLEQHRTLLNENLAAALREYFDPANGKFHERVERLIRQDGELEQILTRKVGSDGSELARTLADHIGEHSPIMKMLDPQESDGFLQMLRQSISEELESQRNEVLSEFSLDNKEGALSRLVSELTEQSGHLQSELTRKVEEVVGEFSLDDDNSALSRLVRKVENAQQTITKEFSLDDETSALSRLSTIVSNAKQAIDDNLTLDSEDSSLSRLKRELFQILKRHEEQARTFQTEVTSALEAMKARREESLRSTAHGNQFEDVVSDFVQREAQRSGDIAAATGQTPGLIKNCKVGDSVVELGPDCAAAGQKFVVEAKEDATYDLAKARSEIETARKNRGAAVGVFVFSRKIARTGQESLLRHGDDIFVIWDAEDLNSDVTLKAALLLAKALCVRQAKAREVETTDFRLIDSAIMEIEREARRLGNIKTWTETVQSNSGKILEEVRKMNEALERQVQILRESVAGLQKVTEDPARFDPLS